MIWINFAAIDCKTGIGFAIAIIGMRFALNNLWITFVRRNNVDKLWITFVRCKLKVDSTICGYPVDNFSLWISLWISCG